MSRKKDGFRIVAIKNFYRPDEIAEIYGISQEEILKVAFLTNTIYQVGRIRLINRRKYDESLQTIGNVGNCYVGRFATLAEAVTEIGLPEKLVTQLASDADALIMLEKMYVISIEKLYEYILRFQKKVDLINVNDEMEKVQIDKRRARDLCLR